MSISTLANIEYTLELLNNRKKQYSRLLNWGVLANILLISIAYYWLAFANAFLLFLYWVSAKKLLVKVGSNGISFPSFPKSFFEWSTLSQVVLKDGLLTIDKKDNTLIQQPVKDFSAIDEAEFNTYCQSQLQKVL